MIIKIIGGIVVLYLVAAFLIGGSGSAAPTPSGARAAGGPQAAAATPDAPRAKMEPIQLNGTGKRVADATLPTGLLRIHMQHNGAGHFAVKIMDTQGNSLSRAGLSDSLLANAVGTYTGEKAVKVDRAGPFVFDVSADGDWQIYIQQ